MLKCSSESVLPSYKLCYLLLPLVIAIIPVYRLQSLPLPYHRIISLHSKRKLIINIYRLDQLVHITQTKIQFRRTFMQSTRILCAVAMATDPAVFIRMGLLSIFSSSFHFGSGKMCTHTLLKLKQKKIVGFAIPIPFMPWSFIFIYDSSSSSSSRNHIFDIENSISTDLQLH